jgi:acyl carrier protein
MTSTEIEFKVCEIILAQAGYQPIEPIALTDPLFEDKLGLDSIDLVELCMAIEEDFRYPDPIADEDSDKWRTVGDVVRFVQEKTSATSAPSCSSPP